MGEGPKISLCFPSPATIVFLSSLFSWGSSRGSWVVLEAPGLSKFSGCRVKLGAPKPPGRFTRQPESPNVRISGPRPSKTPPKINEKTPKVRKGTKMGAGEGKTKRNFGRSRGGVVRRGRSSGGAQGGTTHNTNNNTHQHQAQHNTQKWIGQKWTGPNWPKHQLTSKNGPKWIGTNWLAKWAGQKWIGQNWIGQSRP